jgi:hypothetical protein
MVPCVLKNKVKEWIEGSDSPIIKSFVLIPNSELLRLWNESRPSQGKPSDTQLAKAREQMQEIHKASQDLRACYSFVAAEKTSLTLAAALLEMATSPACRDPFSCLQEASLYASQATKSGNSDIPFRRPLPELNECNPVEALSILGRADCLHSVYFPNEAAYLCSYVARVCRLHRDPAKTELEWNDRWKIVAIYAFNVSVMIRTTVTTVLDQAMQKDFLAVWDYDVVEELERGGKDGRSLLRTLQPGADSDTSLGTAANAGCNRTETDNVPTPTEMCESETPGTILNFAPEQLNQQVARLLETPVVMGDQDKNDNIIVIQL